MMLADAVGLHNKGMGDHGIELLGAVCLSLVWDIYALVCSPVVIYTSITCGSYASIILSGVTLSDHCFVRQSNTAPYLLVFF